MHKVRQIVIGLSLAVAAACKDPTSNEPAGDFTVRVFNDSSVALSNIRVRVSDQDEFTVPRLEHGDMSTRFNTRSIHTNPAVTLTSDGETLTSTPVEGFAGFNPALSPGAYIIVVSVSGSPRRLIVSVQQPVEDLVYDREERFRSHAASHSEAHLAVRDLRHRRSNVGNREAPFSGNGN